MSSLSGLMGRGLFVGVAVEIGVGRAWLMGLAAIGLGWSELWRHGPGFDFGFWILILILDLDFAMDFAQWRWVM